jgi:hypothetical protein
MVYRLDASGHRTLLRGAQFGELSVRDLRDIVAVGRRPNAYHYAVPTAGFAIPTSIVAPDLLFESLELRGPTDPNPRLPLVPRPAFSGSEDQGSLQQRKPVE